MNIGIIISKRVEREFGLLVNQMVKDAGIEVIEIDDFPLYFKDGDLPEKDVYLALSIHSLKDTPRRICLHACGNWGDKWGRLDFDLGGKENTLCGHDPSLFQYLFLELSKNKHIPVSIEATHHGPFSSKPVFMLEIGSESEAWKDENLNQIILDAVLSLERYVPKSGTASLVVGGGHYMEGIMPVLEKHMITHMCPSSQLHHFNAEMLKQVVSLTSLPVTRIIMDVAGVGQHAERIEELARAKGLEVVELHELS